MREPLDAIKAVRGQIITQRFKLGKKECNNSQLAPLMLPSVALYVMLVCCSAPLIALVEFIRAQCENYCLSTF